MKKNKVSLWIGSICIVVLVLGLVACAPRANDPVAEQKAHNETKFTGEQPEPGKYGVVTAEQWKDIYPHEYASYEKNLENAPGEDKHKYLELYPALNTMYKGYGFSKGYDQAASHLYSLESIANTPRISEASLANCITCKSPQFTALVNAEGDEIYKKSFAEVFKEIDEPISCYNCHGNDPSSFAVGNKFFVNALGDDVGKAPVEAQVCGQCHNEYYFNTETKATTNPYTGLKNMTPDAILAYYDEMNFADWEYPGTGTPMIKVQHPEFETIYGGEQTYMAKLGYSCADCHMGTDKASNGEKYVSHYWVSPLENQTLLDNDCMSCHKDLPSQVAAWQDESESRVHSISKKIEEYVNKMVAGVESGSLTGEKLTQAQKLHRNAQFYWDFIMVENSDGAHNPKLSTDMLDKAEAAVDEGLALV